MAQIFASHGQEETARIADDLKNIGFDFATRSGLSMGMDDFSEVAEVDKIMEAAEKKRWT
jgi:DNA-directed RNA polymerase subunit beta'